MDLLQNYIKQWKNFTILVNLLRKVLNYIDRYCLNSLNMPSLTTSAMKYFKDRCFPIIKPKIITETLEMLTQDRNGEYCDFNLLKYAINSFEQLGLQSCEIVKQDDEYIWRRIKNDGSLDLFSEHIEPALINSIEDEFK
jgi:hypothetical protein